MTTAAALTLLLTHVVTSGNPELLKWCAAIGAVFGVAGFCLGLSAFLRTWR